MQGLWFYEILSFSAGNYVDRTGTLFALADFELNLLSLVERRIAARFYLRVMDKQVRSTVIGADKTVSFAFVKPLYCTCTHLCTP